jgi:hypothetical protein
MIHRLTTSCAWAVGLLGLSLAIASSLLAQEPRDAQQDDRQPQADREDDDAERADDAERSDDEESMSLESLTSQIRRELEQRLGELLQQREEERGRPLREGRPPFDPFNFSSDQQRRERGDADEGRSDEQRFHVQQAVEHLRALGWNDEADRLMRRWSADGRSRSRLPRELGRPGEFAGDRMENMRGMMGQLRQAIENLERRARDSEQIADAAVEAHRRVDDAQRRVEELRRRMEARTQELERRVNERLNVLEHQFAERSVELERVVREVAERAERMAAAQIARAQREFAESADEAGDEPDDELEDEADDERDDDQEDESDNRDEGESFDLGEDE